MGARPGAPLWNLIRIAMLIVTCCQWHMEKSVSALTTPFTLLRTTEFQQQQQQQKTLPRRRRQHHLTIPLHSKQNKDPDAGSNDSFSPAVDRVGILAQPIVGISLISVATTGGGLPAGPLDLLGAIEGIAYVVVVLLALQALLLPSNDRTTSQQLSLVTVGLAFVALFLVITRQGCIPNAKPILDYSAYVRVCDPN